MGRFGRVALAVTAVAVAGWWLLHPVCVPLSDADVRAMATPVAARTDRALHVRVFQRRDGRWHQCKPWISRRLFF